MSFHFIGIIDSDITYVSLCRKIDEKNTKDGWCEVVQNNGVTVFENKTYIDVTLSCHPESINYWSNADTLLDRFTSSPKGYLSEHRLFDLDRDDIIMLLKRMADTGQHDMKVCLNDILHSLGIIVDKNICFMVCNYAF